MERYSVIDNKDKREIVLLKSFPCKWGKCSFCDYIEDNSMSLNEMVALNREILNQVRGIYNKVEVINSASVFELPEQTLQDIKEVCEKKGITNLVFEAYYSYKDRLDEIRKYYNGIAVEFKSGIESFDDDFRNKFLKKGVVFKDAKEVSEHFKTICLLVGIKGQTMEMLRRDMEATKYFDRVCINIFVDNTTEIKADPKLAEEFRREFGHLESEEKYDILWNNTDFGVGSPDSK